MSRHPYIIDTLCELACRPLLFAIQFCEVERTDRVTVEGSLISIDQSVMAVDSHRPVIVRDRKGENFPVHFLFALREFEELDNSSHCKGHAMSILPICDIECCSATLHFARQEREVHEIRGHEEGSVCELANNGLDPFELILCERLSPES